METIGRALLSSGAFDPCARAEAGGCKADAQAGGAEGGAAFEVQGVGFRSGLSLALWDWGY